MRFIQIFQTCIPVPAFFPFLFFIAIIDSPNNRFAIGCNNISHFLVWQPARAEIIHLFMFLLSTLQNILNYLNNSFTELLTKYFLKYKRCRYLPIALSIYNAYRQQWESRARRIYKGRYKVNRKVISKIAANS